MIVTLMPKAFSRNSGVRGVADIRQRRGAALVSAALLLGTTASALAESGLTPSRSGSGVYFVGIEDNSTVPQKFRLNFGLRGMGVAPANSDLENSGHHHLLIDTPLPPLNKPIPSDFNHLHFGGGQTAADVQLTPGWHTLQLLLGDKDHVPHSPPLMSPVIRVKVVPPGGPTPSPKGSSLYFTVLKDGADVQTEFKIRFGLKGMGVAPAKSNRRNSGHHHLLIDTDLPDLTKPIPNDFNHLHYGSGQTEAMVKLSPGKHTLQLLFGDKDHIPHNPPLFSEKITVNVIKPRERSPSAPNAEVYFVDLKDGDRVGRRLTVHFGLSGMGVAPAGIEKPNTGHHHLLVDTKVPPLNEPIPLDDKHLHFGAGQTQATITLSPGRHTLQLLLADFEHFPHNPPVMSKPITVFAR